MILEPLSIATGGYIGVGPSTAFCPLPLAIGSDGYIRFETGVVAAAEIGGGALRLPSRPAQVSEEEWAAVVALLAIDDFYE